MRLEWTGAGSWDRAGVKTTLQDPGEDEGCEQEHVLVVAAPPGLGQNHRFLCCQC